MDAEQGIRAGVYVRISKVRDGSTLGVERQEPPCRDFCDGQGWQVAEVYVDNNVSAYRQGVKRDNFERLVSDVRAGRIDAVVTWQADRLLRTVEDASAIVAIAKQHATKVANVGGTIDLSTADGRKRFYELAVAAQYESELKSERLKLKHAELQRRGRWQGGQRPFGYRVIGTKRHGQREDCTRSEDDRCGLIDCYLELEPTEAAEIQRAKDRILAGGTVTGLQREWAQRKIRRVNGGVFTGQHIVQLLVSPRIAGRRRGQDPENDPAWPPIITLEEHDVLRAILGPGRKPVGERGMPSPRVYELSGFLYCAVERGTEPCGTQLRGKPSEGARRYVCDARDGGCEGVKCKAEPLEFHIRDAVIKAFDDDEMGPKIRQQLTAKLANPTRRQELLTQRRDLEDRINLLVDDLADGVLKREQFARATARIDARLVAIEDELAAMHDASIAVRLPETAEAMAEAWEEWNIEERRQVIGLAIKRIWVKPAGQGKRFTIDRVDIDWKV